LVHYSTGPAWYEVIAQIKLHIFLGAVTDQTIWKLWFHKVKLSNLH